MKAGSGPFGVTSRTTSEHSSHFGAGKTRSGRPAPAARGRARGSRYVHGHEYEDEHGRSSTRTSTETSTRRRASSGRWEGMHRQPLDFERLDVYRCAIEFLG